MTPEKKFENRLNMHLAERGIFAVHVDLPGHDGFPDLLLLAHNRCMLIECKYGTKTLRTSQMAFHQTLEKVYNFTRVLTVADMDGAYACIEGLGGCRITQGFKALDDMVEYIIRRFRYD
jgi:Holliday junction resolvase